MKKHKDYHSNFVRQPTCQWQDARRESAVAVRCRTLSLGAKRSRHGRSARAYDCRVNAPDEFLHIQPFLSFSKFGTKQWGFCEEINDYAPGLTASSKWAIAASRSLAPSPTTASLSWIQRLSTINLHCVAATPLACLCKAVALPQPIIENPPLQELKTADNQS